MKSNSPKIQKDIRLAKMRLNTEIAETTIENIASILIASRHERYWMEIKPYENEEILKVELLATIKTRSNFKKLKKEIEDKQ